MRFPTPALLALVPMACTFDGLDAYTQGDAGDASAKDVGGDMAISPDSPAMDVATEAALPPCNLSAPFGTPVAVTELNTAMLDEQAALSPDELTVYFLSTRATGRSNVFTASRANATAPFGSVAALASLNFASFDTWNVTLTGDGLTAYIVTDQGSGDHMYKVTRASSLVAFGTPTVMPSPMVEGEQPFVTPDGSALYYSDATLAAKDEIVRATLSGPTTAVQALSVAPHDVGIPVVDPTETTIYFAVYDAGTFSSYDIWMATRKSATDPWSSPVIVSELSTTAFEAPSWLSADDCELYFTRAPTPSNWNIYVARRP